MTINYVNIGSIAQRGTSEQFDIDASQRAVNAYRSSLSYQTRSAMSCSIRGLNLAGLPFPDRSAPINRVSPCAILPENFQILLKVSQWGVNYSVGTNYTNSNRILNFDSLSSFESSGPLAKEGRIEFSASHDAKSLYLQGYVNGWVGTSSRPPITGNWGESDMLARVIKKDNLVSCKMWQFGTTEPSDNTPYPITSPELQNTPWVLGIVMSNFDVYRLGVIGLCWSDDVTIPIPISALDSFESMVSGVISNPDNSPAQGAIVSVLSSTGGSILGQTDCNTQGMFTCRLPHTPVGTNVTICAGDGTCGGNGLQSATVANVKTVKITNLQTQNYYQPIK